MVNMTLWWGHRCKRESCDFIAISRVFILKPAFFCFFKPRLLSNLLFVVWKPSDIKTLHRAYLIAALYQDKAGFEGARCGQTVIRIVSMSPLFVDVQGLVEWEQLTC